MRPGRMWPYRSTVTLIVPTRPASIAPTRAKYSEPLRLGAHRFRVPSGLELRHEGAALMQEGEEAFHEGHGLRGRLVAHAVAPERADLCHALTMTPRREPSPDARQVPLPLAKAPARRAASLTPEQVAKTVTDKRPSPPGQPTKVEITLRLVLPRAVLERLSARAIREGRNVEAVVAEILAAAK